MEWNILRLNLTQFKERRNKPFWRKSKRKNKWRKRDLDSVKIKIKNREWFIDYLRATTRTKLPIERERERLKEEYGAIIKKNKRAESFCFFLFLSFRNIKNKTGEKVDQITRKKKSANDIRPLPAKKLNAPNYTQQQRQQHTGGIHTEYTYAEQRRNKHFFFLFFLSRLFFFWICNTVWIFF